MPIGQIITNFLSKAYDAVGLKLINDAAQNVPAVRYAAAVLIFAMLGFAGLSLAQGNLPLLIVTIVGIIVLGLLLIILGAAAKQENAGQARFFSWVIVVVFSVAISIAVLVMTSSFLFGWPRPISEILGTDPAPISLEDVSLELVKDESGNLLLTTQGIPRLPYQLEVEFQDPSNQETVGETVELRIPEPGDTSNPSATPKLKKNLDQIDCILNLKSGKKLLKTIKQTVTVREEK